MTEYASSVIVPVYNALPYLEECVGSLLSQTLQDIEIILVDDGSSDGSGAMCDTIAARHPDKVKTIHKPNSGAGLSRNAGLELASGRYIAFLDADDILHPSALECMLRQADRNDLDIVRASRCIFTTGKPPRGETYDTPLQIYDTRSDLDRIALCYIGQPRGESDRMLHFDGGVWGAIYRRSMIEKAGLRFVSEREYGSEDFIFNYQAARAAHRLGRTLDTFVHYRLSPGSISRSVHDDCIEKLSSFALSLERRIATDGYSDQDARWAAMCYFMELARGFLKFRLIGKESYKDKIAWCRRQCRLPYMREIVKEYPRDTLSKAHRIYLSLIEAERMHTLHILTISKEIANKVL